MTIEGWLIHFPVSGVTTWWGLPPAVACAISFFTAMGGVSGAFLLLPFQMSILGFTAPAVSATNLVYNLVAIPGGTYRYIREGRMLWPLAAIVVLGTLPGLLVGYSLRTSWFAPPGRFKLFVAAVLIYLAWRLLATGRRGETGAPPRATSGRDERIRQVQRRGLEFTFVFRSERHVFHAAALLLLSGLVGVVGGLYGIGGGVLIAPFCVAWFGLPVHAVAGAALLATFLTSGAGVLMYSFLPSPADISVRPDWALGLLFGLGGLAGTYLGARVQRRVPQRALKTLLATLVGALGLGYLLEVALSASADTATGRPGLPK